jgi:hypothetical protein
VSIEGPSSASNGCHQQSSVSFVQLEAELLFSA